MLVDTGVPADLGKVPDAARAAEAMGYDGIWTAETAHDPFLPLALAAEHTERVTVGTSIAVAFARNPMLLANIGYDLNAYSEGRFILGLGSQIKPHITKRFSMPWSSPAARMREMVLAIRAIWDCWNTGTKLSFDGDFYKHTLMTPFFDPGPNPHGDARIFIAGVGPLMTKAAGETCDGFFAHGFTTESYLKEVTLPALEEGMAAGGRSRENFEICLPAFVVTGRDEDEMEAAAVATRKQIAFYGSTPAYRGVLDHHGWGDLQTELNGLSKQGRWDDMGALIEADVLGTFAVVAEPDRVPSELTARFAGAVDRLSFYTPAGSDPETYRPLLAELQSA